MLLIPWVITGGLPTLVLPAYMLSPVEPRSVTVPTLAVGVICFLIPLTYINNIGRNFHSSYKILIVISYT